ncbi:hypothetical protein ACRAWF_33065, partial [Streptomyces sp. L7]
MPVVVTILVAVLAVAALAAAVLTVPILMAHGNLLEFGAVAATGPRGRGRGALAGPSGGSADGCRAHRLGHRVLQRLLPRG